MNGEHPLEIMIRASGGVGPLARKLGINHSNVSKWRTHGRIPAHHKIQMELISGGVIKATDWPPEGNPTSANLRKRA